METIKIDVEDVGKLLLRIMLGGLLLIHGVSIRSPQGGLEK